MHSKLVIASLARPRQLWLKMVLVLKKETVYFQPFFQNRLVTVYPVQLIVKYVIILGSVISVFQAFSSHRTNFVNDSVQMVNF